MPINLETINIGSLPNDGTGDPLRSAFDKINNNFAALDATASSTTTAFTNGTSSQVLFEYPVDSFTQGEFQITSTSRGTDNGAQRISLSAFLSNDLTEVKYVAYGIASFGDPITTYSMAVDSGNVQILATPLISDSITHFITSQITFIGDPIPGQPIELDGFASDTVLTTEDGFVLETES